MGLFDRKEKYIRINPNRYVRNGVDHHVPEVPDDPFAKCPVQTVLIPSVFPQKNVLI